jgi:succinyl-diaminopimelate desuccinylase
MNILNEVKKNQQQMIQDMQGLLKINSVLGETPITDEAPFGTGINDSLEYVLNLGKKMGFKVLNVDHMAGHIELGQGKEIIGILCHVDVVPAPGKWTYPPFSATVEGNKLYARGAMDDKGPTIAALYAMKVLKDMKIPLSKRVRLIIGTDEETKWRGIAHYLKVCEEPTIGFSPDANFPLIYGEKGIMSMDITTKFIEEDLLEFEAGDRYNVVPDFASAKTAKNLQSEYMEFLEEKGLKGEYIKGKTTNTLKMYGKSAHAMEPQKGINAAIHLASFLSEYITNPILNFAADKLQNYLFKDMELEFSDSEMKDLTVNVAFIKVDKEGGKLGLNLRYPIHWDKMKFHQEFMKQAKDYMLKVEVVEDKEPHYVDRNSDLVKVLHQAYIHYTNDRETPLMTIGGGTYARALKNAVAFGMMFPNREDVVHQVDEHLWIDDAVLATAIYAKAIMELGKE